MCYSNTDTAAGTVPGTALLSSLSFIDNDEDKVTILCCIVASSTVLASLGPLPIKATGAGRPPAAPNARNSAQREFEDDVKRKRWTGA